MDKLEKVKELASRCAIYIPYNCEAMRIDYYDSPEEITYNSDSADDTEYFGNFYGTGEESGDEYIIKFEDVNLENDMFYELKLVSNT